MHLLQGVLYAAGLCLTFAFGTFNFCYIISFVFDSHWIIYCIIEQNNQIYQRQMRRLFVCIMINSFDFCNLQRIMTLSKIQTINRHFQISQISHNSEAKRFIYRCVIDKLQRVFYVISSFLIRGKCMCLITNKIYLYYLIIMLKTIT